MGILKSRQILRYIASWGNFIINFDDLQSEKAVTTMVYVDNVNLRNKSCL